MGLSGVWADIGGQLKYSNTSIRPARWDKVGLSGVEWGWVGLERGWAYTGGQFKYSNTSKAGTVGQSGAEWG